MTSVFDISMIKLIMLIFYFEIVTVYNVVVFLLLPAHLKQQPHSSMDITRRAFSHAVRTVWNNLSNDINFADSLMNYRSLLMYSLLQTCYSYREGAGLR